MSFSQFVQDAKVLSSWSAHILVLKMSSKTTEIQNVLCPTKPPPKNTGSSSNSGGNKPPTTKGIFYPKNK
ncbi:hypothetical protein VNO78_04806 [Psophocarpus tetragonolobus]|uniref:Uncharacterized protein n=1 Tax=Psophocarpus tetragonolobus TaxID=3891 RepID=A0AAN9T2U8_PSOTE